MPDDAPHDTTHDTSLIERDLPDRIAWTYTQLVETYGVPAWEPDGDALGGLVATILSQHTSDVNSERAYANLRATFGAWEAIRDAPVEEVAEAIRSGGLAETKAERIQRILRLLTDRLDGHSSLEGALVGLDALPLEEAEEQLRSLPGVGPKTAACVLLFSLGRPAFPVDTHVWRVTRRLGWVDARATAEATQALLTPQISPEWRHTLHVNLIQHGRRICHALRPACDRCSLRARCVYYWATIAPREG